MRVMRRPVASIALLLIALCAFNFTPRARAQSSAPKLVVIIVVDQMRADYVQRFGKDWSAGLKRLVTDGALFENAAYPYAATVTCAGHATISTGTVPRSHGIVGNAWWDRATGALVTCTAVPRVKGVGYHVPFESGDSGWRLERPSFADVMRETRRSHVVTLGIKDRSAIMLAGHGGEAVTWFGEALGGWVTSTAFAPAPL